MRKKLCVLILIVCCQVSFSQKQTNFWQFGTLAGLDFNSGSPVILSTSALNTAEGSSSISDASGNLLFYTDGITVWDKTNTQMPNGFGLMGDPSTTQSALIVPKPGSSTLFYIFTLADEGKTNGLRYSLLDMTLNGGNGDVTTKNVLLKNNMTEKLTGVFHCNGTDIWVMAHEWTTNQFAAYLVTASGINAPVISNIGPVQGDVHGQMKFNTNGTKIACCRDTVIDGNFATYKGIAFIDVFKFNNSTGAVSNPLTLTLNNHQLTADNSKLYASYYDDSGINGGNSAVVQFDLSAANIQSSLTIIGTCNNDPQLLRALQLAPDGKIYVTKEVSPFLCVINSPNSAGTSCNYVDNAINVDPGTGSMCMLGLPNFIQSYFNTAFPTIPCAPAVTAIFQSSDTVFCKGSCINFTDLSLGTPTTWTWTFSGATPSSSTAQNPSNICYNTSGNHTVKLIVSNGTNSDTATETITVNGSVVNAGPDIIITPGASTQLNATGSTGGYTWTPAGSLSSATGATVTATPSVTTTYVVTGVNNCGNTDSVTVFVQINCSGDIFVPTAFSPDGNGHNETECVLGNCVETIFFAIYDRWGEKVFESSDQKICWDGNYNGKQMNSGIYVYYLKAKLTNGKEISQKGNISLIR
jgi:gliding motility-associated-like protein